MNHLRKCWDCGKTHEHSSDIIPGVLCPECGSQDTRKVKTPDTRPDRMLNEPQMCQKYGTLPSWSTAENWYNSDQIFDSILRRYNPLLSEPKDKIPSPAFSREFSDWLTHQYRLAMSKGIELANAKALERIKELESQITHLKEAFALAQL